MFELAAVLRQDRPLFRFGAFVACQMMVFMMKLSEDFRFYVFLGVESQLNPWIAFVNYVWGLVNAIFYPILPLY